jgi:cysteinyl-tRNA synthetase
LQDEKMSDLPLPPVPQSLRELLKDYPEHIQVLQDDLIDVASKPAKSIPLFEQALWAVEDALGAFIRDAQKEIAAAKATGDSEAITKAEEKRKQMSIARNWMSDDKFRSYFKAPTFGKTSKLPAMPQTCLQDEKNV